MIGGNVRPQLIQVNGKQKTLFHEKGVDVQIAVDLVANSCDHKIKTAVPSSSETLKC